MWILISMTTPFQDLTLDNFMLESIAVKLAKPATTILVEGMFANIVVNTAVLISMRMKEDAMLNGQLKPAYNLQHGVDSEYITWLDISPRPTDTRTLIPFLKDMELYLPFKYQEIVADAGYESEENYLFLEENGQLAYIKPQNYEISKTRKYRQDIGRMENMKYDEKADCYYCKNGQALTVQ